MFRTFVFFSACSRVMWTTTLASSFVSDFFGQTLLNVTRCDSLPLHVLATVASQLQHLSNKILQTGSKVHCNLNLHPWCIASFLMTIKHLGHWHHKASSPRLGQPSQPNLLSLHSSTTPLMCT